LLDVSPRPGKESHILFIADPGREFAGIQIDNVRLSLGSRPEIMEFINVSEEIFRVLNMGERATAFGSLSIPEDEIAPLWQRKAELQASLALAFAARNSPCPCGSGRKFKRCHGV
jgi:hypothetical protein